MRGDFGGQADVGHAKKTRHDHQAAGRCRRGTTGPRPVCGYSTPTPVSSSASTCARRGLASLGYGVGRSGFFGDILRHTVVGEVRFSLKRTVKALTSLPRNPRQRRERT